MSKKPAAPVRPKRDIGDGAEIRSVFLDPRETYSAPAVFRLLGIGRDDLLERIRTGEIESRPTVTHNILWDDVVRLLMERVPLEAIYAALGDRSDEALPSLLRLERLDVRVPAYVLRVLEAVTSRTGTTVERYLHEEFFDMIESLWRTDPDVDKIPGVAEALFFPDPPPSRHRKP